MALEESGPPSGFLLVSSDSWMGMECLVGVLERPCCLEEISPCLGVSAWEKAGLAGDPWKVLLVLSHNIAWDMSGDERTDSIFGLLSSA